MYYNKMQGLIKHDDWYHRVKKRRDGTVLLFYIYTCLIIIDKYFQMKHKWTNCF